MVHIVLIRPGSTDFDQQGRIQGTLDLPLCEHGVAEVERLIAELRTQSLSVIYHAPRQSTTETATAIAAALSIKAKRIDKLHNLDHGLWQGMLIEDVRRKQPKVYRQWQEQPENICPPEGEMLGEALARVQTSLTKLIKKHKGDTIGVVLPEPLASIAHSYLLHTDLGDMWKAGCVCGSWEILSIDPAKLTNGEALATKSWRGLPTLAD